MILSVDMRKRNQRMSLRFHCDPQSQIPGFGAPQHIPVSLTKYIYLIDSVLCRSSRAVCLLFLFFLSLHVCPIRLHRYLFFSCQTLEDLGEFKGLHMPVASPRDPNIGQWGMQPLPQTATSNIDANQLAAALQLAMGGGGQPAPALAPPPQQTAAQHQEQKEKEDAMLAMMIQFQQDQTRKDKEDK